MNERDLNRLVLEKAKQQVEARKAEREVILQEARKPKPLPERDERPALWGFIGVLITLTIAGLFLIPGNFSEKLGWVVHGVCSKEHTLSLGGTIMPLCQRNTGLYSGFLATIITLSLLGRGRAAKLPPLAIGIVLVLSVAWMGSDGFNSLLLDIGNYNLYTPQPILRILSGLAMGISMGSMILFAFNVSVRANARYDQRIIGSWRDYAILVAVAICLFVLTRLTSPFIAYPLAIFSTVGILSVMFIVNIMIIAMITRSENTVVRLTQLARPAIFASFMTAAEFGLLAWLRIIMERSVA